MPKYVSRKFVNGKWVYEYDQPRSGPVARKRVMSSANRMHSSINDVRKGYGAIATAAKNHERRVRESAGSSYRRDVDDSRGNGGGLRRMTQKENMRSLSRWRQQVAARRGQRLQKQGAETDSGHRTTPTMHKSVMTSAGVRKVNPAVAQKAIRGPKAATERKRIHTDAGHRTSGKYRERKLINTGSNRTARARATELEYNKSRRSHTSHNEADTGYKTRTRDMRQARTAATTWKSKARTVRKRYMSRLNSASPMPSRLIQSRRGTRGRATR